MTQGAAKPSPEAATSTPKIAPESEQGRYGSGGSYGVGGGFDDHDGQDSAPGEADSRAERAARAEAQQEGQQASGFDREVDPEAAPHKQVDSAQGSGQEELAAKKRRGSRV